MEQSESRRIVVLGATGYTGGLIAQELVERGARPVLAGRNADRLKDLAQSLGGLDVALADASDPGSLARLLGDTDVVISTVGPFQQLGRPVAEAAAKAGSHYLDSTGEVDFVQGLTADLEATAKSSGATMLPAFGFDYVPGLLAGALAMEDGGRSAKAVRIAYFHIGPMNPLVDLSAGTRETLFSSGTTALPVWQGGRVVELRPGSSSAAFTVSGRQRRAVRLSGTEVLFLPRAYADLDTVEVYNGWFPARPAQAMMAASALMGRLPSLPGNPLRPVTRAIVGSGGPDAQQRLRQRVGIVAQALTADGETVAAVQLEGPSTYTLTARLLAWGGGELASGSHPAGVLSPLEVFGLPGLTDGLAELGLHRVQP